MEININEQFKSYSDETVETGEEIQDILDFFEKNEKLLNEVEEKKQKLSSLKDEFKKNTGENYNEKEHEDGLKIDVKNTSLEDSFDGVSEEFGWIWYHMQRIYFDEGDAWSNKIHLTFNIISYMLEKNDDNERKILLNVDNSQLKKDGMDYVQDTLGILRKYLSGSVKLENSIEMILERANPMLESNKHGYDLEKLIKISKKYMSTKELILLK